MISLRKSLLACLLAFLSLTSFASLVLFGCYTRHPSENLITAIVLVSITSIVVLLFLLTTVVLMDADEEEEKDKNSKK